MSDKSELGQQPDELELHNWHQFLGNKSIYDVEISAEYDQCGVRGWWSNNWNDWDELRLEESDDYWFRKDVRE